MPNIELVPEIEYDIFISYSSEDSVWAKLLEDALTNRGVKRIFRDKRSLIKGQPWEPQLAKNVLKSQHLVALWSKAAEFQHSVKSLAADNKGIDRSHERSARSTSRLFARF